jgi:hypothetical protein
MPAIHSSGRCQGVPAHVGACQHMSAACPRHASQASHAQSMTASDFMIDAEGLRKRFGTTQALDGVDLAVPTGTVLGVVRPTAPPRPPPFGSSQHCSSRSPGPLVSAVTTSPLRRLSSGAPSASPGSAPRSTRTRPAPKISRSSASFSVERPATPRVARARCSSGSTSRTRRDEWQRLTAGVCVVASISRQASSAVPSDVP